MGCSHPDVLPYLYFDSKRKIYGCWRFSFWHLIYRTGYRGNANPLDTHKMRSGYSVCWSKLIRHGDVLKTVLASNPRLGDTVYFGKVKNFKKIIVIHKCPSGSYKGKHIVKTKFFHK